MARRYRLAMDFFDGQSQTPASRWGADQNAMGATEHKPTDDHELTRLRARIEELEATVADYEALLTELPDLFERKFQQRLEPLLERYRLLAQAQDMREAPQAPLRRAALRWGWPGVRQISSTPDENQSEAA